MIGVAFGVLQAQYNLVKWEGGEKLHPPTIGGLYE